MRRLSISGFLPRCIIFSLKDNKEICAVYLPIMRDGTTARMSRPPPCSETPRGGSAGGGELRSPVQWKLRAARGGGAGRWE
ncbi:hypothetical protein, partial [Paenibacillus bouchesdurhonensis]|uniref:hypothetical protein n=1 Tax=Paenibacillus bouchesdurhonensis TaxID=1870990 RepID=UPI001F484AE4